MSFNDIEYTLCDVYSLWRRLANVTMKSLGISSSARRTLVTIQRYPGISQNCLAKKLEIEPQNMLRLLDKLEAKQWIEKRVDPNDRRAKQLFITDKAKPILQSIHDKHLEIHQRVLHEFDDSRLEKCKALLLEIKEQLFVELNTECSKKDDSSHS